MTRSGELYCWT